MVEYAILYNIEDTHNKEKDPKKRTNKLAKPLEVNGKIV